MYTMQYNTIQYNNYNAIQYSNYIYQRHNKRTTYTRFQTQNKKVTKIIQFVDSNLPWPPSFFRFAASNDPCPEIDGTLPTRRVIFLKCKGTQSVNRKGKFQGICIITY